MTTWRWHLETLSNGPTYTNLQDDFLSWDEAAEACKQLKDEAHLVEINSEEEEMFVRYYFDVCLVKLIHILRSQIHTNYTRDIHDVLEEVGAGFWIGATNIDRLLLYLFDFDLKIY